MQELTDYHADWVLKKFARPAADGAKPQITSFISKNLQKQGKLDQKSVLRQQLMRMSQLDIKMKEARVKRQIIGTRKREELLFEASKW